MGGDHHLSMERQDEKGNRVYPLAEKDYKLLEEIGQGVSATVYRATCVPFNEEVAIKNLDLEKCSSNLDEIRREAQTVSLISHPNVVRAYCSFVVDQSLWVVMPYLAGGSCLHVMKVAYPDGFEEPVIATVLKETLKALDYLHKHGHIHRDVKAGNILINGSGGVKLGDFGVSACMFDTGDRQRSRNTFVGTPCWMAPEVMEQVHGYDFKADIWSFGITALELAHGHAPFSKYPPMKVLLMTLQNAPPGLDYERDKRFSKSFKEMIAMCLVKDPTKRPAAEKLLKHSFFKNARSNDYIAKHVLEGLPPLGERVKNLKLKDAARLAQKKMPYGEQEEKSQSEYKRGVSCWNFNVEDLKAGAALIHDEDSPRHTSPDEQSQEFQRSLDGIHNAVSPDSAAAVHPVNDMPESKEPSRALQDETHGDGGGKPITKQGSLKSSTLPQLKGLSDFPGEGAGVSNQAKEDGKTQAMGASIQPTEDSKAQVKGTSNQPKENGKPQVKRDDREIQKKDDRESHRLENGEKRDAKEHKVVDGKDSDREEQRRLQALEKNITSLRIRDDSDSDRERDHRRDHRVVDDVFRTNIFYRDRALGVSAGALGDGHPINGIPLVPRSSSYRDVVEEKVKAPHVQRKGRFSVTSEDVDLVEGLPQPSTSSQSQVPNWTSSVPTNVILPQLRSILQHNSSQQDLLVHLISSINGTEGSNVQQRLGHGGGSKNFSRSTSVGSDSGGEMGWDRDQHLHIIELQNRITSLVDELQLVKLRNVELEHQLIAKHQEEDERIHKAVSAKENG